MSKCLGIISAPLLSLSSWFGYGDVEDTMDILGTLQIVAVAKAGLLRALFFGEKCATCVQFMECAGVR